MPAMMERSGEAHAKFYTWLAEQRGQGIGEQRLLMVCMQDFQSLIVAWIG